MRTRTAYWGYAPPTDAAARRRRALSTGEEIASAIIHGLGVAGSIVALVLLVIFAAQSGDPFRIAASIVFGASLIFLYLASTLYHSLRPAKAKRVFKVLDHAGIYLLIAGSYTPFTLVTLRGPWGWSLFAAVWVLAIIGIALEASWVDRPRWLSALVFLAMGWIVVVAIKPLLAALPAAGLWLLLAGGLAYTFGTVFYVARKVPYFHAVWHLWVLGGSLCHVLAVLLFVI
ncbi:MAG: hemolysin III family protein [Coriobacteriia bacterium]